MYTISKTYTTCTGHYLRGLPEEHPCATQHGHNYKIKFTLEAERLDDIGFVLDYGMMDAAIEPYLKTHFDHKNLNAMQTFATVNPTAENIARLLYDHFSAIFSTGDRYRLALVTVCETEKTEATYGA